MAQKRADLAVELSKLTKEQLLERLLSMECPLEKVKQEKKRKIRQFDFDAYKKQHVAMKIAYLGWDYHGYASQISFKPSNEPQDLTKISKLPTIEEYLFKALMTTKLIESPTTANYSRCGRTDAGVSATGQVIGVTIRSNKRKDGEDEDKELPVAVMLNSILPPEIRVLDICPAPDGFNARFNCRYREYHYYFPRFNLDIESMRKAAEKILGKHDFRNFAKRDPSKVVENHVRDILFARIETVECDTGSPLDMFKFIIRGTAFLYHQVRCTMAVFFLVGQGKESPEIVDYLLDNLFEDWRPTYQMASEIPLVLVECGFDGIEFGGTKQEFAKMKNQKHFHGIWKDKMAQALTIKSLLQSMSQYDIETSRMHTVLRKP